MSTGTKVVHRFLRQPNINSSIYNRISNRYDPFNNTLTVLKDPKTNRELYLIGTTNSSTTLAYRTKKLVEEVKPSSVYVQASQKWWNIAKSVQVIIGLFRLATNEVSVR
jgi:ribulose 1,5-bisphosphate carboxylase large subunit-like protein